MGDQLATHFCRRQLGIQARRAKLRICLALAIHNGGNIVQQMWQMVFAVLAPTQPKAIHAGDPMRRFVHSFADGSAIPPQLSFGQPLTAFAQSSHYPGHEHAARAALEILRCLQQQHFDFLGQFHARPSASVFLRAVDHTGTI